MPNYTPLYVMSTIYQPVYRPDGYIALGMRNIFTASKNIDFRLEGFVMAPFRELSTEDQEQVVYSDPFPALHYVLSTSFVYNSLIGPLSATLNYYDDGSPVSFFVNLGYIIFNRSAF
jgi:NTE family protein